MESDREHASSSASNINEEEEDAPPPLDLLAAEQYVSPLSADDVVALATSLRAHPSFFRRPADQRIHAGTKHSYHIFLSYPLWGHRCHLDTEVIMNVQGEVRAACPHLADNDAYATAVCFLVSWFGARGDLEVTCGDAGQEAVAAFYAALEHPTCTVRRLTIRGASFGTRAAAASLGLFLNINSTITTLHIEGEYGFCDGAVWTAFSEALISNATLEHMVLHKGSYTIGNGRHVGPTLADPHKLSALRTVEVDVERQGVGPLQDTAATGGEDAISALREEMEGWGFMLKHNSTIIQLDLHYSGVQLPQGRDLFVPLWEGLVTNTTLLVLTINGNYFSCDESTQLDALIEVTSAVDDADSRSLGAMLGTNQSLKTLGIMCSGIVCNASVFDQGLSHNSTLKTLFINVNAPGAQALMAVLAAPALGTTNSLRLKYLAMGNLLGRRGFPTPLAVRDMLAFNKTLIELGLDKAPYNNHDWATIILPALSNNDSLQRLHLTECPGVDGGLVYDALLELLDCNTHLRYINLSETPLSEDGKSQVIDVVTQANSEYRDALKNVPTVATTSCRLVLCGYPFAGKTTLLETMLCAHSNSTHKSQKRKSQSGDDTSQELSERTWGIDIQHLMTQGLTLWVWDFAGQKEFHPLRDSIFPNGASIHAATAFVFTFNLVQHGHKMENGANASSSKQNRVQMKDKQQFQQEFSYWLKFICSNAIPRPSRAHKPPVLVVITHKDRLVHAGTRTGQEAFIIPMLKEWVRDVARKFDDKLAIQADTPFFVDATNKDDPDFAEFVQCALDLLRQRMDDIPKVPAICDFVAKALGGPGSRGQQLQPIISLADFQILCRSAAQMSTTDDPQQLEALRQLFSDGGDGDMDEAGVLDKASKVVAAYLRDAGELLYIEDLPFLVRNPRWFAHGILGYLIDIFSPYSSHPDQDFASRSPWCYLFELYCSVAANDAPANQSMSQDNNMLTNVNGMVTKDFLTDLLERAVDIVGLDRQGTNINQLILLMEKLDICYQTEDRYLIPALFQDEDNKSEKGEVKREWELVIDANCNFVAIRLQCSDSLRTIITPGFYPRLQVELKNLADQLEIDGLQCICTLEKGFCRLTLADMEILVEYSGYFDYFVDIMVKSYLSQHDTKKFVEKKIINRIRWLCASPKGCQGVTLVEAIIRPDCVGEDITLCRFRQSVQVATLEQQIASGPDLKYLWPAVKDEHGNTVLPATCYRPHDLLDPKWVGWEQEVCYPDSNVHQGRRRGVAVIVSMVMYNNRGNRSGGCEDEAKWMALIQDLQFEVKLLQDSKAGELQKQLKGIAATNICGEDESFLCFVMGHGESTVDGEHFMRDQDEDMIMLDDIVGPFKTCQHLHGKPKVFFVISCRGGNLPLVQSPSPVHVKQPTELKFYEGTEVRYLHELTDCLMVFSTSVGSPSARYPEYGTTFVGALVTNFYHLDRQATDVLGILNYVNQEVATEEHEGKDGAVFGQCPVVVHTLIKRLYWKMKSV